MEKFTSRHKIHYKVDTILTLKYEMHRYKERMINLKHNQSFKVDTLNRCSIKYDVLTHRFKSIEFDLRVWKVHQIHFRESSFPQNLKGFELLQDDSLATRATTVNWFGTSVFLLSILYRVALLNIF